MSRTVAALSVVGWAVFWTVVVLGVAGIILEWQALQKLLGL